MKKNDNNVISKNMKKIITEWKKIVDKTNLWLESNVQNKFEDNYKKLKEQTLEITDKIVELKKKIAEEWKEKWDNVKKVFSWKNIKNIISKSSKTIKEKKADYKEELNKLYEKLKLLVWNMSLWLEEKRKKWIVNSMKSEFKKAQNETKRLFEKIWELKTDLIDDKFIDITYNWKKIHVIFNKESNSLKIWEDNYKFWEILINEKIKDNSIKIISFLIKKEKPVLSIIIPSLVAKKYSLSKNESKHFIIEWIIKRDKIAEVAEWLVLYWKSEFELKMNGLDVRIELEKLGEE
jgi:hypothetical protein